MGSREGKGCGDDRGGVAGGVQPVCTYISLNGMACIRPRAIQAFAVYGPKVHSPTHCSVIVYSMSISHNFRLMFDFLLFDYCTTFPYPLRHSLSRYLLS